MFRYLNWLRNTLEVIKVTMLSKVNKAIPIDCFVSHCPTDSLFFKVKRFSILKRNCITLKLFFDFLFNPTDRPNLSSGGRWETKYFIGMV